MVIFCIPQITLLDPELTLSQPFSSCVATAMDALSHTLESAVCTKSNHSSYDHALRGFKLLVQNMERVWQCPDDMEPAVPFYWELLMRELRLNEACWVLLMP